MPSELGPLNEEALSAIQQFIAEFTIPIMYEFAAADGILGTGTLFKISDRYFIVTAAHLFDAAEFRREFREEFNPEKLACPDQRSRVPERPTTFGNCNLCSTAQTDFDHDAAFIELKSPEKIERLSRHWTFLTLDQAGKPTDEELFFLAGYPVALVTYGPDRYSGPLAVIRTNRLPNPPEDAIEPIDLRYDLFFKYSTKAKLGTTDDTIESPGLRGASGGSICQLVLTEEPLWMPSKAIRIVAIQSSAWGGRTWFRAKSWLGVAELLRRTDSQLADEIARHISRF
jgi:hypothetical protein